MTAVKETRALVKEMRIRPRLDDWKDPIASFYFHYRTRGLSVFAHEEPSLTYIDDLKRLYIIKDSADSASDDEEDGAQP